MVFTPTLHCCASATIHKRVRNSKLRLIHLQSLGSQVQSGAHQMDTVCLALLFILNDSLAAICAKCYLFILPSNNYKI